MIVIVRTLSSAHTHTLTYARTRAPIGRGYSIAMEEPAALDPAALAAFSASERAKGVVYLSRVPPFMKPIKLRHLLAQYGTILRVYLAPEDDAAYARRVKAGGNKRLLFTEAWVEFADKYVARATAATLNNTPVADSAGRKAKSNFYATDRWNIKYLKVRRARQRGSPSPRAPQPPPLAHPCGSTLNGTTSLRRLRTRAASRVPSSARSSRAHEGMRRRTLRAWTRQRALRLVQRGGLRQLLLEKEEGRALRLLQLLMHHPCGAEDTSSAYQLGRLMRRLRLAGASLPLLLHPLVVERVTVHASELDRLHRITRCPPPPPSLPSRHPLPWAPHPATCSPLRGCGVVRRA